MFILTIINQAYRLQFAYNSEEKDQSQDEVELYHLSLLFHPVSALNFVLLTEIHLFGPSSILSTSCSCSSTVYLMSKQLELWKRMICKNFAYVRNMNSATGMIKVFQWVIFVYYLIMKRTISSISVSHWYHCIHSYCLTMFHTLHMCQQFIIGSQLLLYTSFKHSLNILFLSFIHSSQYYPSERVCWCK